MAGSSKKTVVLGASENPSRYSNMAVRKLRNHGHEVVAVGRKKGTVQDVVIETGTPQLSNVDTVTLYLNPQNQEPYYEYILGLQPKRIVFNPGTENEALESLAKNKGIETVEGCTLVMLSIGTY